jgi:hypothetical protein
MTLIEQVANMKKHVILSFILLVILAFQATSSLLASAEIGTTKSASVQYALQQPGVGVLSPTSTGIVAPEMTSQQLVARVISAMCDSLSLETANTQQRSGDISEPQRIHMETIDEIIDDDAGDDSVHIKDGMGGISFLVNSALLILARGFIYSSTTVRYHTRR